MDVLGLAVILLLAYLVCYRCRHWLSEALSDPNDDGPSTSRLIAFVTALTVLGVFAFGAAREVVTTGHLPDPTGWGDLLFWCLTGGSAAYGVNKASSAVKSWLGKPAEKPKEE